LVGVAGVSGSYRADTCLWRVVLRSGGGVPWIQSFEACFEAFGFACIRRFYRRFNHNSDFNYFIINILILKGYDTGKFIICKQAV
jgi:hypothetical protein